MIKENEIKIAGEVVGLFCPNDNKLLIFDNEKEVHWCDKCKKYWRYKGKQKIIISKAKGSKKKIKEESAR